MEDIKKWAVEEIAMELRDWKVKRVKELLEKIGDLEEEIANKNVEIKTVENCKKKSHITQAGSTFYTIGSGSTNITCQ
jgi:hypothetical protein